MANSKDNRLRSIDIWRNRPNKSGSGSRGKLATFKINYINKFIIIYAQDSYSNSFANWSGHMNNSPWRQIIEKENVKLIKEQEEPVPGSAARFFIYEKL